MSSPLPRAVKRSSTGGAAGGNGGAEATPLLSTPSQPSQSETVKEKEQVKLSPLHQALVDIVKARPGKRLEFSKAACMIVRVIGMATVDIETMHLTMRCA